MEYIKLSASMVRRLIRIGIKTGHSGLDVDLDKEVTVFTDDTVAVRLTLLKPVDTTDAQVMPDQVKIEEEDLSCSDTIILSPSNDVGRALVAKYGNVWRVSSGRSKRGDTSPHTWIITSVAASKTGKFAGTDRKNIAQENLPADQSDPMRWARVIYVSRFPTEFNWKFYYSELKVRGITIKQLNTVNYDVTNKEGKKDAT